jgi:hypothetical protein
MHLAVYPQGLGPSEAVATGRASDFSERLGGHISSDVVKVWGFVALPIRLGWMGLCPDFPNFFLFFHRNLLHRHFNGDFLN